MSVKIKRMIAGLIDFYILCFLASIIVYVFLTQEKKEITLSVISVNMVLYCFLLLFKDIIFRNASIGKRFLKIEIVKNDKSKFSFTDSLKRTLPLIFLLPLELLLVVIYNQRLGDIWSKSQIVSK